MRVVVPGTCAVGLMRQNRRGVVLVMALVVLLVISLLCAEQVRRALADRRQERVELLRMQTDAVADAALRMAIERQQADGSWSGAEWTVPAEVSGAATEIKVEVQLINGRMTATARARVENNLMCSATRTGEPQS